MWHEVRKDFENQLIAATNDESIRTGQGGSYKNDIFFGHCNGDGGENYNRIMGRPESFAKIPSLYGHASQNTLLRVPAS